MPTSTQAQPIPARQGTENILEVSGLEKHFPITRGALSLRHD